MLLSLNKRVVSLCLSVLLTAFAQDEFEQLRKQMVKLQIEARGIHSSVVLNAMRKVPRHLFVPLAYQHMAYQDRPLPIGYNQTISQPYIVAYMTDQLGLKQTDKVLEIGTGSGYQAAVLSEIVTEVYTIELVEELGLQARDRFVKYNYTNIHVRIGDGYVGWKAHAPYDAIIVTAAADSIPSTLVEQLKVGGSMIIPVGKYKYTQVLKLVEKKERKISVKRLLPVRFVPFIHEEE